MFAAVVVAAAAGHLPFFVDRHVTSGIERPVATSQVYYFKGPGALVADASTLPSGTAVELLVPELRACDVSVVCDGNTTVVPLSAAADPAGEPWTQSSLRSVIKWPSVSCNATFSVASSCSVPWAAVVGDNEVFELSTWMSMPAIVAKVHGSYWTGRYVAGYNVFAFGVAAALVAFVRGTRPSPLNAALCVAAVFIVGIWVAKVYHAVAHAAPDSAAAFGVSLMELVPLFVVVWLYVGDRLRSGIAGVVCGVLMLLLGLGFVWGAVAIIVAGALRLRPSPRYAVVVTNSYAMESL
jgi:hypothetical protein